MKILPAHRIAQSLLRKPKFKGRDFLIERLPKLLLGPAPQKCVFASPYGFQMYLRPAEDHRGIERTLYERGVYEFGTMEYISTQLNPGDVFIDVGANVGLMSLVAASKVGVHGTVYAFEPHPTTYSYLKENADLNGFGQLQSINIGLGSESGTFALHEEEGNRGGATLVEGDIESHASTEITVQTLDHFAREYGIRQMDMIKVDIEGWEFEMLRGAQQSIEKWHPVIVLEIDQSRHLQGGSIRQMVDWLLEKDYEVYKFARTKNEPSELVRLTSDGQLPVHDNLVFKKK